MLIIKLQINADGYLLLSLFRCLVPVGVEVEKLISGLKQSHGKEQNEETGNGTYSETLQHQQNETNFENVATSI
jgi:hypothetical protein